MAQRPEPYPDNAPGAWSVDHRCIDCGTCRVVAPAVFGEAEDHAFVHYAYPVSYSDPYR